MQTPAALHTPPVQAVPVGTLPPETQTGAPDAQWVVPVVHGFPVLQLAPSMHATHDPDALHTPPEHADPAAELPAAVHVDTLPAHVVIPVRHGVDGIHATPATQTLQLPALSHVPLVLHVVPLGAFAVAMHTGEPLVHESVPRWHAVEGMHDAPETHGVHVPVPLHTPPGHVAPAAAGPVMWQAAMPVVQSVAPTVQGLPVLQAVPGVHELEPSVAPSLDRPSSARSPETSTARPSPDASPRWQYTLVALSPPGHAGVPHAGSSAAATKTMHVARRRRDASTGCFMRSP